MRKTKKVEIGIEVEVNKTELYSMLFDEAINFVGKNASKKLKLALVNHLIKIIAERGMDYVTYKADLV